MADPEQSATAAARALNAARWRSSRPDRLAREVTERSADLSPDVADALRAALRGTTDEDDE